MPTGLPLPWRGRPGSAVPGERMIRSVAAARIDRDVLSRGISIIAAALRQIISRTWRSLRADNGAGRSSGDRAGCDTARAARQQSAKHAAHNGPADSAGGRIRRRRGRWGRCIGHGRWRVARRRWITSGGRRSIRALIGELDIGHIGRRAVQRLRIIIPDAPDIPPPAVTAVAHFVTPASAFPGEAAVIGVSAELAGRKAAVSEMGVRPAARTRAPRTRMNGLRTWPARRPVRGVPIGFLSLRRERQQRRLNDFISPSVRCQVPKTGTAPKRGDIAEQLNPFCLVTNCKSEALPSGSGPMDSAGLLPPPVLARFRLGLSRGDPRRGQAGYRPCRSRR